MKVNILGVNIDSLTMNQALDKVTDFTNSNKHHQIVTANPEIVLKALKDKKYQELINSSDLVTADGIGLLWAAKFLSLKSSNLIYSLIQVFVTSLTLIFIPDYCKDVLPERVAGVDLMEKICQQASQKGWKIYLLGGEGGIANKTADVLKNRYLNLQIVGAKSGPEFEIPNSKFQFPNKSQISNSKLQNIIDHINKAKPDILFVAFGSPKQDFWIKEDLSKLPTVKVAVGVGGAFDFISGNVKRAPEIYRDLNIEWLYRLFHQPWRVIRIFNATVRFVFNVVKYKHLIK